MNRFAEVNFESLSARNFQLAGIQAELMEYGRVQVGDIVPIFDRVEPQFVRGAVRDTSLDAATGEPGGEAEVVMPSTILPLQPWRTTELTSPNDECFVQEASTLEVFEQSGNRQVHLFRILLMIALHVAVCVPGPRPPAAVVDLDEPHAPLDESAGGQTQPAKRWRCCPTRTVAERRPGFVAPGLPLRGRPFASETPVHTT